MMLNRFNTCDNVSIKRIIFEEPLFKIILQIMAKWQDRSRTLLIVLKYTEIYHRSPMFEFKFVIKGKHTKDNIFPSFSTF